MNQLLTIRDCVDCTEYDEEGKIVNPVARVRMNRDGNSL